MSRRRLPIIVTIVTVAVLLPVVLYTVLAGHPPVIAGLEVNPVRVAPSSSAQIVCTVSSRGDGLSYDWSASAGEFQGTGATVTWTAPAAEDTYTISVTVTDERGGQATGSVDIEVTANRPPEITSLTADAGWTFAAGTIEVKCEARDPDGDTLTYAWEATGGTIADTGEAVTTWTAPDEFGEYHITVTVGDGKGGSVQETVLTKVMPDQPPDIAGLEVTKDAYGHCYLIEGARPKVGQGQKYDIECLVSNRVPGTEMELFYELFYQWTWEDGQLEGEGSMITWTAPSSSGFVTVTVTVSDIAGNTVSESITLNVVGCSPCTFRGCP